MKASWVRNFTPFLPPLTGPVTCPRCLGLGRRLTCCACVNTGTIDDAGALARAVGFVWRIAGCRCEICAHLPPVPLGTAHTPPHPA